MTFAGMVQRGPARQQRGVRRPAPAAGVKPAAGIRLSALVERLLLIGAAVLIATLARADSGYVARRTADGVRVEPRASAPAAAGLDIRVRVGRLVVAGGFDDVDIGDIAARPARDMTIGDLLEIAASLQARYVGAGYFLARFYLPVQTIHPAGAVTIACVDVEIESIDVRKLPARAAAPLQRDLARLVGRSRLKTSDYERQILVAERQLGLGLTARPEPGSRPDRVKLVIEGSGKAYAGEVSFGGLVSQAYKNAAGAGSLSIASPFGFGERVYAAGTLGRRWDEPQVTGDPWGIVAGIEAPLGIADTSLDVSGMHVGEHRRLDDISVLDYRYARFGWRLVAPILLSATESLVLRLGPDFIDEIQRYSYATVPPFAITLEDRTRLARISAEWTRGFASGLQLAASLEASAGSAKRGVLVEIEGLSAGIAPDTSVGKLSGRVKLDIPIGADVRLGIFGRGQYAFRASLPPSEQIQLLQAFDTPGLDSETSEGDSGGLLRAELARSFRLPTIEAASFTPYVFGSTGFVTSIPPVSGQRTVRGSSGGAGLRVTLPAPTSLCDGIDVSLELARVVTDGPTSDYTGLTGRVALRF